MVKTEILDPELAEIGWSRLKFTWCTGYYPKRYRPGLDIIIHKDSYNFGTHRLIPILIFYIKANLNDKHLRIFSIKKQKSCIL